MLVIPDALQVGEDKDHIDQTDDVFDQEVGNPSIHAVAIYYKTEGKSVLRGNRQLAKKERCHLSTRTKMLMKTLLSAMLLLWSGFDTVVAARAGQEDLSRIEVHRTPGKPMQLFDQTRPAEAITARHDGARYELIVAVNVPRKGIGAYSESSVALSRQDWDRLVGLVQQQGLLRFKPDQETGRVYDFGDIGFTIEGRTSNAQQWSKPIKNFAAPQALMLQLARLARQKLPSIALSYFPD